MTRLARARSDETSTKDIDTFRQFLEAGRPGPHAYVVLLGLHSYDLPDLLRHVRNGLPYKSFERFLRNLSLPADQAMEFIDIPRRTMVRRKREGRLQPDESDRLLRASRVFARALELFEGDREAAVHWLTSPIVALGGARPIDLARTEVGAREVEREIGRAEDGVYS
ncbi:MAG TPA: antitoxin Xre-like helix-turn-helix domain-containing protein [Thermoanaerobaculia bacterium]|jgi:putative toxin-antitoxin system antitoxin component (TIGR02293 family)